MPRINSEYDSKKTHTFAAQYWAADEADFLVSTIDPVEKQRFKVREAVVSVQDTLAAPLWHVASTPGVGKSHHARLMIAEFLLRSSVKTRPRILFLSERHDLLAAQAKELRQTIQDVLGGKHFRRFRQLSGRSIENLEWALKSITHVVSSAAPGACADEYRAERHKEYAGTPVSRTRTICDDCKLQDSCGSFLATQLGPNVPGIYFVSAARLALALGKYDPHYADFVILDEDPTGLTSTTLASADLTSTPTEQISLPAAKAIHPEVFEDRKCTDLPLKGLTVSTAQQWFESCENTVSELTAKIEGALLRKEIAAADDKLPELRHAMRLRGIALACFGAMASGVSHAPLMLTATRKDWTLTASLPREDIRRTWATPTVCLNGTSRVEDLMRHTAHRRPTVYIGAHVKPGDGVTHIAVSTDCMGGSKLIGRSGGDKPAPQSNIGTFERLGALLVAMHGDGLTVMHKAGRELSEDAGLLRSIAALRTKLVSPSTHDRLHFGAQRGNDSFKDVRCQLTV